MRKKSEDNNLHKKKNKEQGFTVAELLVVMAIISILSMISIPLFAARLEETRRIACLYNCQTMARLLRTETQLGYMDDDIVKSVVESMGGKDFENILMEGKSHSMLYKCKGLCKGGTYMISDSGGDQVYYVKCTLHGMTATNYLNKYAEDSLAALVSLPKFAEYFKNRNGQSLNSTGPNWGVPIKQELANALNITVDFDFYVYRNGNQYKIYISEPLGEYMTDGSKDNTNKKIWVKKHEFKLKDGNIIYEVNSDDKEVPAYLVKDATVR
ncbi:MAG: prepilin-type N-terminal cleavage/methylation domain-containing protein, partial [Oscillospiraceae bacterium]|nr:prepilin-type N-terminal cleavage/methylation domain-containing protein [Oscillospiraceae bacterium]